MPFHYQTIICQSVVNNSYYYTLIGLIRESHSNIEHSYRRKIILLTEKTLSISKRAMLHFKIYIVFSIY